MKKHFLILSVIALFFLASCDKETEGNETKISSNLSDESHNTGENCMTCHLSGGSGEGWFTTAGSVYDNTLIDIYPNATVKLTTEANGNGTLVNSIEVDAFGNFYTTEDVSFGNGLYVALYGTNGEQKFMSASITNGKCNACHGNTTDKIFIE